MRIPILLSCFMIFAVGARCKAEFNCPLELSAKVFMFRDESRLAALVRFGRENHISLGVESLAGNPLHLTPLNPTGNTVKSTILQILGASGSYHLYCVNGVVIIRDDRVPSPKWLDRRLPSFQIPKATLATANIGLWMRVEKFLDPSQRGFGGDGPPGDPEDQIGPYNIKGATIRRLLCVIAGSSKGAAWVTADGRANQVLGTAGVNRLWTLVLYATGPT